jgi:hypothetical protein
MITDGRGSIDWSGMEDIAAQIRKENIALSILFISLNNPNNRGVDFDDEEFKFKEEDKDSTKVILCNVE